MHEVNNQRESPLKKQTPQLRLVMKERNHLEQVAIRRSVYVYRFNSIKTIIAIDLHVPEKCITLFLSLR